MRRDATDPGARGADRVTEAVVTLGELARGAPARVVYERLATCAACDGAGHAPGALPSTCAACAGRGTLAREGGFGVVARRCDRCSGEGRLGGRCASCGGAGRRRALATLDVRIPSGAESGERIVVCGGGDAGTGTGPAGDLHVTLRIDADPRFIRQGCDLTVDVAVDHAVIAGGGVLEVPLVDGGVARVTLHPAGGSGVGLTPHAEDGGRESPTPRPADGPVAPGGTSLVLRGHGLPRRGAPPSCAPPLVDEADGAPYRALDTTALRGDLHVRLHVRR